MIKYFRFDTDCATFTPTENPRRIRTKRAETKNRKFSTSRWKFTRPSQRQFFPQKRTKKKKKILPTFHTAIDDFTHATVRVSQKIPSALWGRVRADFPPV